MLQDTENDVRTWLRSKDGAINFPPKWYCKTRDIFQARLERLTKSLFEKKMVEESIVYLLVAVIGEIGNNSFDHNIGNWPDAPGIFFCFEVSDDGGVRVVLADRGQGVFNTLHRVKADLRSDGEALTVAFTEKISGRAPENRGNGLKFVRSIVEKNGMELTFFSGRAKIEVGRNMKVSESEEKIRGALAIFRI